MKSTTKVKTSKVRTSTGFKGIYNHKRTGKFEVKVTVTARKKSHRYYVGLYPTLGEAILGRQKFITDLL